VDSATTDQIDVSNVVGTSQFHCESAGEDPTSVGGSAEATVQVTMKKKPSNRAARVSKREILESIYETETLWENQLFGTDGTACGGRVPLDPATVFAFGLAVGQGCARATASPKS